MGSFVLLRAIPHHRLCPIDESLEKGELENIAIIYSISLGDGGDGANTERFRVSVPLLPHLCLLSAL